MTPPSAMASKINATNAGPDPATAVQASKCFSSKKRHRPHEVKMARMSARDKGSATGVTMVIPSRICSQHGANKNAPCTGYWAWLGRRRMF